MLITVIVYVFLAVATAPFVYYLIAIFSTSRFFGRSGERQAAGVNFTPPVSNLKPVRGLDPEAYENFASFCRQDYPEYEIIFCISEDDDSVLAVIERLKREFPDRSIRVLFGSEGRGSNDKVSKLARLVDHAAYENVVITDSDVRVRPDYLRTVIAPFVHPEVGAVTCLYVSTSEKTWAEKLQSIGMISDFFPGILVARQLDGVKFALGQTIATTRTRLAEFGGYRTIENRPADDLLVGRLIAEGGYKVELLPYAVEAVSNYRSIRDLLYQRLRWLIVMRHMRPRGHLGLLLTQGLPWSLAAIAVHPSVAVAAGYFGLYVALRLAMTWAVGISGLRQRDLYKNMPIIIAWDTVAFAVWLASFMRNSIRWRGGEYYIRDGRLIPATANMAVD